MYTAFPTELEGVLHVWMTDEAFSMCGSCAAFGIIDEVFGLVRLNILFKLQRED